MLLHRIVPLGTIGTLALCVATPAAAVPLFARQTGQQCAACHNGFPELTPYGRLFKLNGYTFGGGQSSIPPISAMVVASFTHTQAAQPGGAAPHFAPNDNPAIDFASLFYGGVLLPNVGLFGQVTYDNIGKAASWDNHDLRYATVARVGGHETVFGVTVNNNPTVQDVWNSTPAWGYPWLASGLAPTPAAATLIEGGLAQQVVGVSPYVFYDRLVYAEVGAYRSLGSHTLYALGANGGGLSEINGVAPYWRLALEPNWGHNSWEVGTFGIRAAMVPGGVTGFGTDHITDIGVDTQYQYIDDSNSYSLQADLISESQRWDAGSIIGNTSNENDHLRSAHIKASYIRDQTYEATLAWFRISGSSDALLYSDASANNSPDSSGFIGEVDYMPFNHGGPAFWSWMNVKFGAQYTYYTRFNGGTNNFDGAGNNASGANTFYLFAWLAF